MLRHWQSKVPANGPMPPACDLQLPYEALLAVPQGLQGLLSSLLLQQLDAALLVNQHKAMENSRGLQGDFNDFSPPVR